MRHRMSLPDTNGGNQVHTHTPSSMVARTLLNDRAGITLVQSDLLVHLMGVQCHNDDPADPDIVIERAVQVRH